MDFRLKAFSSDQGSNQPSFSSPETCMHMRTRTHTLVLLCEDFHRHNRIPQPLSLTVPVVIGVNRLEVIQAFRSYPSLDLCVRLDVFSDDLDE